MIKRSGVLMIELLLVIGVITGFMSFFYMKIYVPQQLALAGKKDVKNQEQIKVIIDMYIKLAATYNINQYKNITNIEDLKKSILNIEPGEGDSAKKISISFNKDIIDENKYMKTMLLNSNCSVINTEDNSYNYRCYGVGDEITIIKKKVNDDTTLMNDIYTNNITIFIIKKLRNDKLIGHKEFSLINTYKKLKEDSLEKLNIIKKRLVSFNKRVYTNEIGSPCSYEGGLDSWDDFNIPWVWKINSKTPSMSRTLCNSNGETNTEIKCECLNFESDDNDIWSANSEKLELSTIINKNHYNTVLKNLFLPSEYRYDEVGNPIYILLFSKLGTSAPTKLTDVVPLPPSESYNVSDDLDIAQYRQGEIFVRPINGYSDDEKEKLHFEKSRITCFYD